MRWDTQQLGTEEPSALPGLARLNNLVRSVQTPEFAGVTFHEVLAKSALNRVPRQSQMPFGWTINPYRGCSHACVYCLDPDTLILTADGRQKPLRSVIVGDAIMGTQTIGKYRRYVATTVLASWATVKRAFRITLADGTEIVASGDHRFLTERGWKYVMPSDDGTQRPYLTVNNKLIGFGLNGLSQFASAPMDTPAYRRGYLSGMIRGDGMLLRRTYTRSNGRPDNVSAFRLALADPEALTRAKAYLVREGVVTRQRPFAIETPNRRPMNAIHTSRADHIDTITRILEWPEQPDASWNAGYLAGIFDAEGSCSNGVLRISNSNADIHGKTMQAMTALGISYVHEPAHATGVPSVRVVGGLPMRSRFFSLTAPAITRKLDIVGRAVKSDAQLQIVSIDDLDEEIDMIDITTGTGDFIANGVVSHNCFARPTHTYLDFNAGADFDNQVVVKINVAEVLTKEVSKASWGRHPVALGTNTDPYQRAEGRYALMPGIIQALARSGTPLSILTKGTLLRRDLPLLADVAQTIPVDLAMSIAIYDDDLQKSIEPGTPSAKARLATVTAVREAGLDCSVFLMPILPYLTDTKAHLDEALRRVADAGGTSVLFSSLYLKPGVKPWFMHWLERQHPELVPKYRDLYAKGSYAPKEYRAWLAARISPLIRAHRLERGREDPSTGGIRSKALGMLRDDTGERVAFASDDGSTGARILPSTEQPMLF